MTEQVERCPKCGTRRLGGDACARCGLLVVRWASFAAAETSAALDEAWRACEAAWQDQASHQRVLDIATQTSEVDLLAQRYRRALADRPDDPIAPGRLRQIAVLVEAAARTEARAPGSRGAVIALRVGAYVVASLLLLAAVWMMWRAFGRPPAGPAQTLATPKVSP